MTLPDAVDRALALPEVVDPDGLRAAWTAPWCLAILGHTGVGKTTLANRLTGQAAPTGLGGVTRGVQPLYGPDRVVLDTEGIDDPRVARAVLAEPLARADAVVWVLDGRAPSSATERALVEELIAPHTPVHLVVARVDLLDDDERAAVLARIERLHPDVASRSALDCRTSPLPEPVLASNQPGAVRVHRLRAALDAARRQVPEPPDAEVFLHDLRRAWRSAVRSCRDAVLADVTAGTLNDATAATATLVRCGAGATEHVQQVLDSDPFLAELGARAPRLPVPRPLGQTPAATLAAGMAGQAGAARAVRAQAGSWLAEGDVCLLDWEQLTLGPALARRAAALDDRRRAYADAMTALDG